MPILVGARFIQGLGGGAIGPTAYVAIGRTLPERLQPRMFALLSTAWVVPGVVGPSIAAIVGEFTTWRLVFLGLIPLLAVAGGLAVTALRRIPAAAPPDGARGGQGDDPAAAERPARGGRRRAADRLADDAGPAPRDRRRDASVWCCCVPAFRRLTPPGTLVLAAGVPAAVLLRGVMTFAFFSGGRLHPAAAPDVARHARPR